MRIKFKPTLTKEEQRARMSVIYVTFIKMFFIHAVAFGFGLTVIRGL